MRSNLLASSLIIGTVLSVAAQTIEIPATTGTIIPPLYISGGIITQTNDTDITLGGKAIYNFSITNSGNYVIYAVVGGRSGKSCQLKVALDEDNSGTNGVWQFVTQDKIERRPVGSTKSGQHRDYNIFPLAAGEHQLVVRAATAGTKIEKFYIRPHLPPNSPGSPQAKKF